MQTPTVPAALGMPEPVMRGLNGALDPVAVAGPGHYSGPGRSTTDYWTNSGSDYSATACISMWDGAVSARLIDDCP